MTRKQRPLTHDERQLWQRLARTVRPLTPSTPGAEMLGDQDTDKPTTASRRTAGPSMPRDHGATGASPSPTARRKSPPPPVTQAGDPRQQRHVARGRRQIDATLDLHGMTQDQAFSALTRFLAQARAMGYATLLVITGKGVRTDGDEGVDFGFTASRGILRRRFLDWADGPFREHISSVAPSHQRHGGGGAFYVFLKKRR